MVNTSSIRCACQSCCCASTSCRACPEHEQRPAVPAEDSILGPSANCFSMFVKLHVGFFAITEIIIDIDLGVFIVCRYCIFYLVGASSEGTLIACVLLSVPTARPCALLGMCNFEPLLPPVCLSAAPVGLPDLPDRIARWAGCGCSTLSVAALRCCKAVSTSFFMNFQSRPSSKLGHQLVEHSGTDRGVRQTVFRRLPYVIVFALKASLH